MIPKAVKLATVFAVAVGMSCAVFAQSVYREYYPVMCRIQVNGNWEVVVVRVDLKRPDINDDDGWGTARHFSASESTKENCNDEAYAYTEAHLDHAWEQEQFEFGEVRTFTHEDNKRFWDWYYAGYTAPEACDYTQNCHGYAFGVGDWPDSAVPIIDNRPIPDPLPPDPIPPPCYVAAEVKEAQIASVPPSHSIKVQGAECEVELPPGPPIPIPNPDPGEPPMAQALVASWEQFRESGTYSQTAECPDSVDLKRAGQPGFDWHAPLTFQLLKPNGG